MASLPDRGFSQHIVKLAWILAAAYVLVVVYASLQPFRDWRAPPAEILNFLFAPWARYVTLEDAVVNFLAYVPLGFLLSVGCGARLGPAGGAAASVLAAAVLSLLMESVQMFLPARIASNVDLVVNSLGALFGAMAAPLFAPTRILGGKLHALRHRLFVEGMTADVGLVVVGLWLATHFHPNAQLFGTGGIRATFDLPAQFAHTPLLALTCEAVVVLFNLLGVGLLLAACVREGERPMRAVAVVVGAALLIKVFTVAALVKAAAPLSWLTPGVLLGLAAGWLLLLAAVRLPQRGQLAAAAACIAVATVAINLAPVNPYLSPPPRLLARGASHFLNFSGIARALSELWPLLAVSYLVFALGKRRSDVA
ncbi:MAG TPA: VanZ family protein [Burkholderiales bacterium]|nr:VanZ family protein [Burkholderiales bacterium]